MSYKIEGPTYIDENDHKLPHWELSIADDSGIRSYSDEDIFLVVKNWKWIKEELQKAYKQGLKDGKRH